jgi:hypothetical protein
VQIGGFKTAYCWQYLNLTLFRLCIDKAPKREWEDKKMANRGCLKSFDEPFATVRRGSRDLKQIENCRLVGMLSPQQSIGAFSRSKDMRRGNQMTIGPRKSGQSFAQNLENQ